MLNMLDLLSTSRQECSECSDFGEYQQYQYDRIFDGDMYSCKRQVMKDVCIRKHFDF